MRKTKKTLNIIFDELEKTGLISSACAKAQIPRSTFYRWYNNDLEFRLKVDDTVKIGRANMVDFAESKVIKNIQDGNQRAAEFYLRNNDNRYRSSYAREFRQQVDLIEGNYRKEFESITAIRSALFEAIPTDVLMRFAMGTDSPISPSLTSQREISEQQVEQEAQRIIGLKYYGDLINKLMDTKGIKLNDFKEGIKPGDQPDD